MSDEHKTISLGHLTPQDALLLNSALKGAGLSLDLAATAVVYEVILLFMKKKGDLSLKDISKLVSEVLSNKDFNPVKEESK